MPNNKYFNLPVTFNQKEKLKLKEVAENATSNSSDSVLLARANHTGTQAISTVTGLQTALDAKVPATTTVNGHALSANIIVTKSDISLGNVDNTSDTNKPVSTAMQTALNLKQDTITEGAHIVPATDNLSTTVVLVNIDSELNTTNTAYNDLATKFNTLLLRLEAQNLLSDV